MIDININYYRPAYFSDFIRVTTTSPGVSDTNPIGQLCGDIWAYYYPDDPLNVNNQAKPLDDSIYLWKINPTASAACNACGSVKRQNTLDFELKINQRTEPVPLAMSFFTVSGTWYDSGLRIDPKCRLAYDKTVPDAYYGNYGGWTKSQLFYNINPLKFCLYPTVSVYDYSNDTQTSRTLSNMVSYINADTDRRVVLIRSSMYCGDVTPRTNDTMYASDPRGSSAIVPDILTDRPLCDNLAGTVGEYIRDIGSLDPHPDYKIDSVYSPFNQAMTTYFYNSTMIYTGDRQLDIGYYISTDRTTFTNGRFAVPDSHGRCTAWWCKVSINVQTFDDVVYRWRNVVYTGNSQLEIPNGYDISQFPGTDRFKAFSELEIIDRKGASYGEACRRAVLHELAFWGFWFADTQDRAANDPLGTASTGAGIFLPEKVGGVTTGRYFTGEDIQNVDYADADSVAPYKYLPEESGEDVGDFSTIIHSGVLSAAATYYALKDQGLKDLIRYLNTTYNPDADQLAADFKGVNPFDYITSVKYYPFSLPYAVAQQINVGPLATGATGYILPYTYGNESYSYFDMGSYTFAPYFNNFLDYSATQILLYLPWCGSMQLDPALWIPQTGGSSITLNIRYSFDWVTGSCTAFIFRNGYMMETADGQVGIDIPLSLLATGSYQAAISQAMIAYKQAATSRFTAWLGLVGSAIGTAVAAASGVGAPAVVGGLAGIASSVNALQKTEYAADAADYTLNHTQPQLGSVSAASPFNGALLDQRPKLLISRPKYLTDLPQGWQDNYAKSYGYACSIPTSLNSSRIKGLTKVSNPRLQGIKKTIGSQTFTPTERELDMIKQALAEGIIL